MKRVLSVLTILAIISTACNSQAKAGQEQLGPKAFHEMIDRHPDGVVLDVRTAQEWAEGYIDRATLLDFHDPAFKMKVSGMDKSNTYFVYCAAGARSRSAAQIMRDAGFKFVYELDGGLQAWEESGLPVKRD